MGSLFGGVFYFWSYCSVLAVYEDMLMLSQLQRVIALFIAVSVLGFMLLLLKNCNFMWYGLRRECTDHELTCIQHKQSKQSHDHPQEMDHTDHLVVDLDLKTSPVIDIEPEIVSKTKSKINKISKMNKLSKSESNHKTKKRRRRRRKRNGKLIKSN